jgi:hypothetical protein
MIESCAAAAVLGAALVVVAALLTSLARQRQGASRHAQAVIVADNLLERLTATPYEAVTPEQAEFVLRASNVAELLPHGEAKIRLSEVAGPPAGKRIEVDVSWRAGGGPSSRHWVATWVYKGADRAEGEK